VTVSMFEYHASLTLPTSSRAGQRGRPRDSQERWKVVGHCLLILVALVAAQPASARVEFLRWTQTDAADVERFEAFVRTEGGAWGPPIRLGKPNPDSLGVFNAEVTVDDAANVYIAVRAVDFSGLASELSNSKYRAAPPAEPAPRSTGVTPAGTTLPRLADSLVYLDFASGDMSGWLHTTVNNGLTSDATLFTVSDLSGNSTLSSNAQGTDFHSHYMGSRSGASEMTNVIYRGRMAINDTNAGIGVTAYSDYPNSDTYYGLHSKGQGADFEIANHPEPAPVCIGNVRTGVVPQAGRWYEFELSVTSRTSGNEIRATIWPQGDAKPASSQATCVDSASTRPMSGKIGVWATGSGDRFWDDLQVTPASTASPIAVPPAPPTLIQVTPIR
jgi:hypothetical protein